MNQEANWINYLLDEVVGDELVACAMIEQCGRGCAMRRGDLASMEGLREAAVAAGCTTDADFAAFMKANLPLDIELDDSSLTMRFHKEACTCAMAPEVASPALCNCTLGHERAIWSTFFGRPIEAEVLESFLRGGSDCVVKLYL